jgi:hypothetical protein
MPKDKPTPNLRRHHWLVAGKVTFTRGEDPSAASVFEHNITITNDKQFVPANLIGQAQQGISLAMFEQVPDPTLKIINVHIQDISYLGCMTADEFYTPPPADKAEPAGEPAVDTGNDPFALKGPTLN